MMQLDGKFVQPPVVYRGFLWFLSKDGYVFRVAPYGKGPFKLKPAGSSYGSAPFTIGHLYDQRIPHLISLSDQGIGAVSLLDGAQEELDEMRIENLFQLDEKHRICFDTPKAFYDIAEKDGKVYFLKNDLNSGKSKLEEIDTIGRKVEEFEIENDTCLGGPIIVGEWPVVYGKNKIGVLDKDGTLKQHSYPPGFQPYSSLREIEDFHPHHLSSPFLAKGDSVFLPGTHDNRSGFLHVRIAAPTKLEKKFQELAGGTYTSISSGHPVVSFGSKIWEFTAASLEEIRHDGNINEAYPPFYQPPLSMAYVISEASVHRMRFYWESEISEFHVSKLKDCEAWLGFLLVSGCFVFMYRQPNERIGIVVWDL
jgi:hypothetical protein